MVKQIRIFLVILLFFSYSSYFLEGFMVNSSFSIEPESDELTHIKSSTYTVEINELDYYDDGGTALGVYVSGNYAYIADETDGLEIIDISDPTNIFLVKKYNNVNEAQKVIVSGIYAYLLENTHFNIFTYGYVELINLENGEILDITIPEGDPMWRQDTSSMRLLGNLYIANGAWGVEAWYPPYPRGFPFYDSPNKIHTYYHGTNSSRDVDVAGGYVYVADGSNGLEIYDESDESFINSYYDDGYASVIFVSGSYAYVGEGNEGFEILDISDPYNLIEVGSFYDGSGYVEDIVVSGNYAYVADRYDGLEIIDISDPYHPEEVVEHNDGGAAMEVFVSGSYVYLADGTDGLELLEVTFIENAIAISSPSNSSKYQTGKDYQIIWNSTGEITHVNITLHKNGVFQQTLIPDTLNEGLYSWSVSPELSHYSKYQVKIEDASDPSVYDISDYFEIYTNSITVTTPDSTTSWQTGFSQNIYWTSTGYISNINIILYEDGDFISIIESNIQNEGSCSWTIPTTLDPSNLYQIKIVDSSDSGTFGWSDYFEIKKDIKPIWEEEWFWGFVGVLIGIPSAIIGIIEYYRKKKKKKKSRKK